MKIDNKEFEIIFTMKDEETICVKADKETVDGIYEVFKGLKYIKGKVEFNIGGKKVDLRKVDYFRWYMV